MSAAVIYPHLSLDPDGTARVAGTRYKIRHLAGEHYHYCWSAEEILRQHPDLRPRQVYAALTYFYDHYDAIVKDLQNTAAAAAAQAERQPLSRAELLARRATRGS